MCEHAPNREAAMVVLRRDETGRPTVWCDPCIAPLVDALNSPGLTTVASCCGHGEHPTRISLADGREVLVYPSLEASDTAARDEAVVKAEALREAADEWHDDHFEHWLRVRAAALSEQPTPEGGEDQ